MESVVLTVLDPNGDPMRGAIVTLHDPLDGALYGAKMTGSDGVATFTGTVPAGVVAYLATKAGYQERRGTLDVVADLGDPPVTPMIGTAVLTPLERPAGPSILTCMVSGYMRDVGGQPTSDTIIVETIGQESSAILGGAMVRNEKSQVQVDPDTGAWQLELPQGAMVRIFLPSVMLDRRFRVPAQANLNITDLRRWLGEKQ
jgi:hypothetical protein